MRIRAFVFSSILLCFCALPSMAGTVAVTTSASFTGVTLGDWSFSYTSGAPDLFLKSVTIDLGPSAGALRFDTYSGPGSTFGSQTSEDISGISLTGPGTPSLLSGYASGQALDGGTLVTFSFLDFTPGDVFRFSADVDKNLVVYVVQNCNGLRGTAWATCQLYNLGVPAANLAAPGVAQTVGPNQMAGAAVTFTFGGANYNTTPVIGTFQPVTLQSIITGLAGGDGVVVFNSNATTNADVTTPEPACLATFGAGLGLLLALARRRRV